MNKVRYILIFFLLVCSLEVSSQTYEKVWKRNFWNGSSNVAGIRQDTLSASFAELYAGYEGGGFRDTWQASQGWNAGAVTSSIRHLENVSLAGSFSFEQKEGYDMCGSMFIKPGFYPVDILEFTPGRKTIQTYAFDGGISYDVSGNWRIGAKMDFESANMAKRKDLRHSNMRLEMKVVPGFMYHKGDFAVGASAIIGKTSETIDPEQIGTSESSYYAFLDKGMMYGTYSVWTGSGLHLSEAGVNGFPVKDFSYGGAGQVQYKALFADISWLRTKGRIGEKEYVWFLFPSNEIKADLGYRFKGRHVGENILRLGLGWKGLTMDESVLEKVTENGVTTVLNHGFNKILSRGIWHFAPEYEFICDLLEFKAGLDMDIQESMSTQMYPYVCTQSLIETSAYLEFVYNYRKLDIGVSGIYGCGRVSEQKDMASEGSGVQTEPYRLQEWYDRQMEYRTASRVCGQLMLRYNFNKGVYLETDVRLLGAFDLKYHSDSKRIASMLKLGYNF